MQQWLGAAFSGLTLPAMEVANETACIGDMHIIPHDFDFMYERYIEFVLNGQSREHNYVFLKGSPMVIPLYDRQQMMREFTFREK